MAEYQKYDNIIKRFRSSGGLKHDFQAYKLYSLVKLLNQEQPRSILELGTGTSTMIFKEYVSKEDGACLTSVDESMHWLDNTR
jgi:ubiquinone/menaquinone biosynthesis C-methylase UbiE